MRGEEGLLQELWLRFKELGIDVRPGLVPLQAVGLPSCIVVWQSIITTTHDIEGSQIPARKLHWAKELVPHIGAQNGILPFGYLRS